MIPDRALDILRTIGDPRSRRLWLFWYDDEPEWFKSDQLVNDTKMAIKDAITRTVRERGLAALAQDDSMEPWLKQASDLVPADPVNAEKVRLARSLFADYGTEIVSALLLAALPQAYAAEEGSKVLAATGQLQSHLARRIAGTGQFLASVMAQRPDDAATITDWTVGAVLPPRSFGPPCWRLCAGLRLYHAAVRATVSGDKPSGLRGCSGNCCR